MHIPYMDKLKQVKFRIFIEQKSSTLSKVCSMILFSVWFEQLSFQAVKLWWQQIQIWYFVLRLPETLSIEVWYFVSGYCGSLELEYLDATITILLYVPEPCRNQLDANKIALLRSDSGTLRHVWHEQKHDENVYIIYLKTKTTPIQINLCLQPGMKPLA